MNSFGEMLFLICVSGAAGGAVAAISTRNSYKLRLPVSDRLVEVGFLGDLFIGAVAGVAFFFVAGTLFNINFRGTPLAPGVVPAGGAREPAPLEIQEFLRITALGVLSGYAGIKVLQSLSDRVLRNLSDLNERMREVESTDEAGQYTRLGDAALARNEPEQAHVYYAKALQVLPNYEPARIGQARAYRRQKRYDEAIRVLTAVLERNPKSELAYYNRACYKNLAGTYAKDDVLRDLATAIGSFPPNKAYARQDIDFTNLHADPDFLRLTT